MRALTALLLSLILTATSLTMAVARGRMAGSETVILCSGSGLVAVALDAEGQPIGRAHVCPDCTVVLFAPDLGLAAPPARAMTWSPAEFRPVQAALPPQPHHLLPAARGPPVPV
jgi:hypothetical protein